MPTYSYACTECGNSFDIVQKFTDDSLTVCNDCGGRLRKLFNSVGIVFKGSGFYRTDSRSGTVPAGSDSQGTSSDGGASGSSESSSAKSDTAAKSGSSAKAPASSGAAAD